MDIKEVKKTITNIRNLKIKFIDYKNPYDVLIACAIVKIFGNISKLLTNYFMDIEKVLSIYDIIYDKYMYILINLMEDKDDIIVQYSLKYIEEFMIQLINILERNELYEALHNISSVRELIIKNGESKVEESN